MSILSLALTDCRARDSSFIPLVKGSNVPELILPTLDGETFNLRSLAGQPIVLNFWATWCEPCRREIPDLVGLAGLPDVQVLSVVLDAVDPGEDGLDDVRAVVEGYGVTYPVLRGDESVLHRFQGFSLPYTLVIDRDLKILTVHRGTIDREKIESDLRIGKKNSTNSS